MNLTNLYSKTIKVLSRFLKNRRLTVILIFTFLLGVLCIATSELFLTPRSSLEEKLENIFIKLLFDIGMALMVASIIGFTVEQILSEHFENKIINRFRIIKRTDRFGLKDIFTNRQMAFDEIFEIAIPGANHQIRILGICVSLFHEANRESRRNNVYAQEIKETILKKLKEGCFIKVLNIKRYPEKEELKFYGITKGDFFSMRERDEDDPEDFKNGDRLKIIANKAHCYWINILVKLAESNKGKNPYERCEILKRLQINEYLALPSLSIYNIDYEMYVTPYLYKKHCFDIPTFKVYQKDKVSKKDNDLYSSYENHFKSALDASKPSIPTKFIQLLVDSPNETIKSYKEVLEKIKILNKEKLLKYPDFNQTPEFYRAEEQAIEEVIKSGS